MTYDRRSVRTESDLRKKGYISPSEQYIKNIFLLWVRWHTVMGETA